MKKKLRTGMILTNGSTGKSTTITLLYYEIYCVCSIINNIKSIPTFVSI